MEQAGNEPSVVQRSQLETLALDDALDVLPSNWLLYPARYYVHACAAFSPRCVRGRRCCARRSRVVWENKQRKKQGLEALGMDELIAKAWRYVRERFRSYQAERKAH